MKNYPLRALLLGTYPVRPGQEARAWKQLQERHSHPRTTPFQLFTGYPALSLGTLILLIAASAYLNSPRHVYIACANSPQQGVYATSFYSDSAQAQVVWLDGLTAARETPTSQDPTILDHALSDPDSARP